MKQLSGLLGPILGVAAVLLIAAFTVMSGSDGEPVLPVSEMPQVNPAEPSVATPFMPKLDVLRIDGQGNAIVAGRVSQGSVVRGELSNVEIYRSDPAVRGDFAGNFSISSNENDRLLQFYETRLDGSETAFADVIIVHAFGSSDPIAPSAMEEGTRPAPLDAPQIAGVNTINATSQPLEFTRVSPSLLKSNGASAVPKDLSIEAIEYGEGLTVRVAGLAPPNREIRIFLDGQGLLNTSSQPDGGWSVTLSNVSEGLYALQASLMAQTDVSIDQSVSIPFQKAPDAVLQSFALNEDESRLITVQPGFTLWGISREQYGEGTRYVQIFETNKDQISDPDLIYPGQVFTIAPAR